MESFERQLKLEYVVGLCKKRTLNQTEINLVINMFENKYNFVKYEYEYFLIVSSIHGNYDMIKIIIDFKHETNINDNEPLRICAQNNHIDCALLLFNDSIDIEQYDYSVSYENLKKIKSMFT